LYYRLSKAAEEKGFQRYEINILHSHTNSLIDEKRTIEQPKPLNYHWSCCGYSYDCDCNCNFCMENSTTDRKEIESRVYLIHGMLIALNLNDAQMEVVNMCSMLDSTVITVDYFGTDNFLHLLSSNQKIIKKKLHELFNLTHKYEVSFNSGDKRWEVTKKKFAVTLMNKKTHNKRHLLQEKKTTNVIELQQRLKEFVTVNDVKYEVVLRKDSDSALMGDTWAGFETEGKSAEIALARALTTLENEESVSVESIKEEVRPGLLFLQATNTG